MGEEVEMSEHKKHHTHTCTSTHAHTHARTSMHKHDTHTHMHTHTHTHARTHTHTHTHTHLSDDLHLFEHVLAHFSPQLILSLLVALGRYDSFESPPPHSSSHSTTVQCWKGFQPPPNVFQANSKNGLYTFMATVLSFLVCVWGGGGGGRGGVGSLSGEVVSGMRGKVLKWWNNIRLTLSTLCMVVKTLADYC